jgi:hypothetical protein
VLDYAIRDLAARKRNVMQKSRVRKLPPVYAPLNGPAERADKRSNPLPGRLFLPPLIIKRFEEAHEPDSNMIRQEVERDFVAREHADAILAASKAGNFAVSFRVAGPATISALQRGAAAKGHDILEKTIKASSIANAYAADADKKMAMVRRAGIEGYVGHWERGELKGIYLASSDRRPLAHGQKHEIYPIDMSCAEALDESLVDLKSRERWQRLPFSGDYDMHDLLSFSGAGRPAIVPSQSLREQEIVDAINQAVAAVDPARPFNEVEGRVIRHGPQVNFPAYSLTSPDKDERSKASLFGLIEAVARPGEFPVAFANRGKWQIVRSAAALEDWYRKQGAQIKSTWSRTPGDSGFVSDGDGFVRLSKGRGKMAASRR